MRNSRSGDWRCRACCWPARPVALYANGVSCNFPHDFPHFSMPRRSDRGCMAKSGFRLYRLLSDIIMYTCTDTHIDTRCHISTKITHILLPPYGEDWIDISGRAISKYDDSEGRPATPNNGRLLITSLPTSGSAPGSLAAIHRERTRPPPSFQPRRAGRSSRTAGIATASPLRPRPIPAAAAR